MQISCSTYGHRFLSLEGALRRLAGLGFRTVDIMATRPHLLPEDYKNDIEIVQDLLHELGLKVSAITGFDGHPQWHLTANRKKHREDTVAHVKKCIEIANALD